MNREEKNIDYTKIKEYWDDIENLFEGIYSFGYRIKNDKELGFYRFKKDLNFIKMHMPQKQSINFLDIGCGPGNLIADLKNDFSFLEGLDISESMINIARNRFQKFPNVILNQGDINKYKLRENLNYDLIHIGEVFEYVNDEDIVNLLKKLRTVTNDNSVIIVRSTIASKQTFIQDKDGHMLIRRTINDIKKICEDAGFKLEILEQNYYYNYAGLIGYYRTRMPILKKLRVELFDNKIIKFLLLYIPLKILSIAKRNLIIDYFVVLKH